MKAKVFIVVWLITILFPANAAVAAKPKPICAIPYKKSIRYTQIEKGYGELIIDTAWRARSWQRDARITQRIWINGKLQENSTWRDTVTKRYELAAEWGMNRKPQTVAFTFTIKSRDCTRTVRSFRSF